MISGLKGKEAAMAKEIVIPALKAVGVYSLGALIMSWVVLVAYSAIRG